MGLSQVVVVGGRNISKVAGPDKTIEDVEWKYDVMAALPNVGVWKKSAHFRHGVPEIEVCTVVRGGERSDIKRATFLH